MYYESWPIPHPQISIIEIAGYPIGCHMADLHRDYPNYFQNYDEASNRHSIDCNIEYTAQLMPRPLKYYDLVSGETKTTFSEYKLF